MSIVLLPIVKNFESFVIIFVCSGSLLFFHQAPQVAKRVEQKERKRLKILKNHLGQFHHLPGNYIIVLIRYMLF